MFVAQSTSLKMVRGSASMVVSSLVLVGAIGAVLSDPLLPNRIVGGQFAEDTQMPYQIALFYNGKFRCGGSIVGARHVLTAAHCVVEGKLVLEADQFSVHAGSANMNLGGHRYSVLGVYPHKKYGFMRHDIAMLEMKEAFDFDAFTQPIELMEEEVPTGGEVVISGYGRIGDDMPTSDVLRFNTMYVVDHAFCKSVSVVFRTGLICFNKDGNHGACNGDSGGPAVYAGKLVGVANFVMDHCGGDYPDGYAKVSFYVDWIRQFMQ